MSAAAETITRAGNVADSELLDEIIRFYEIEPDLQTLPPAIFDGVGRLTGADVVTYAEFHGRSQGFRVLVSVDDDPQARARAAQAVARHMHSHPFWAGDPAFFGERALRESDFFTDEEYFELPIAKEAFLPSHAHRQLRVVMPHDGYLVSVTAHRVVGRTAFGDAERDRLQALRSHLLRCYRQAQERTLARLRAADRLRYAFPELTPRQLEVAAWIAQGRSNEDIAAILDVGIDTVKAHAKVAYDKMGATGRHEASVIAHTTKPFAQLPPLWTLELGAVGA
jgi:DNA-binding CsgD family transcriptional regulator